MKTECPHCGQHYEVEENFAGQNVECSQCGKEFEVRAILQPEILPKTSSRAKKIKISIGVFGVLVLALICLFFFRGSRLPDPISDYKVTDLIQRDNEIGFIAQKKFKDKESAEKDLLRVVEKIKVKYAIPLKQDKEGNFFASASLATVAELEELQNRIAVSQAENLRLERQKDEQESFNKRAVEDLARLRELSIYDKLNSSEKAEVEMISVRFKDNGMVTDYHLDKASGKLVRNGGKNEQRINDKLKADTLAVLEKLIKSNEKIIALNTEKMALNAGKNGICRIQFRLNPDNTVVLSGSATGNAPLERLQDFCKKMSWYEESKTWFNFK